MIKYLFIFLAWIAFVFLSSLWIGLNFGMIPQWIWTGITFICSILLGSTLASSYYASKR